MPIELTDSDLQVFAEATDAPQIVIYVDQDGKPVSTITENVATPVATPEPTSSSSEAAPSVAAAEAPAPTTTSSSVSSSPTYVTGGGSGFGLVYSPYSGDGSCKSQTQVETDFKSISTEYTLIRTYGTDCDQVANVLSVVKARKIKLFAGIFDISDLPAQVATIVKAANGDCKY